MQLSVKASRIWMCHQPPQMANGYERATIQFQLPRWNRATWKKLSKICLQKLVSCEGKTIRWTEIVLLILKIISSSAALSSTIRSLNDLLTLAAEVSIDKSCHLQLMTLFFALPFLGFNIFAHTRLCIRGSFGYRNYINDRQNACFFRFTINCIALPHAAG